MSRRSARRDGDRDLVGKAIHWQQIEEDLEQAAIRRAIDRRARNDDRRRTHARERVIHVVRPATAEQCVRRKRREIDERRGHAAFSERGQRMLEERARLRARRWAARDADGGECVRVVAFMCPMRASTSAAGRNANRTAVEFRMTAGRGRATAGKRKRPGLMGPPGASRFSTLFYVAAIGGKSPRAFDCVWNLWRRGCRVKREVRSGIVYCGR